MGPKGFGQLHVLIDDHRIRHIDTMVQLRRSQPQNAPFDHVQLFTGTVQQRCQLVVQFRDVVDHKRQNIGKELRIGLIHG